MASVSVRAGLQRLPARLPPPHSPTLQCPFTKFEMKIIDLFADGHAVRLSKPKKDEIVELPDGRKFLKNSYSTPANTSTPYEVTAYSSLYVAEIDTLTDEAYDVALKFLTLKFGGEPEDDGTGQTCEWSITQSSADIDDIEAQVEAHHEMLAEIAMGK
jgi:hypothetical protein